MAIQLSWSTQTMTQSERTRFFYAMYGRVRTINKANQKYKTYYPGFLDEIPYRKIGQTKLVCETSPKVSSKIFHLFETSKCNIRIEFDSLETGRNRMKIKYQDIEVKGLNC